MASWVVVGRGYVGQALAQRLVAEGEQVIATRRSGGDGAIAYTLGVPGLAVPAGAIVVCLAPPGEEPAREVEVLGADARDASRFVYVSSTGVYAPAAGALVDEGFPIAPVTKSGRARAAAERAVAALPLSTVILRVAGIWGPGRGLVDRMRAGTYRIVGDGTSHVSRIHVDDLVEAIVRAGRSDVTGAINIADDDPAPIGEVADALAQKLGLPSPPRVPADSVDAEVAGMLTADRRIVNMRMKRELGIFLRYPSWRAALD